MDITQHSRTATSPAAQRSSAAERDEARTANRGGYSFLLVHGVTWLSVAASTYIVAPKTAALMFMFQGLVAFPASLLLERALGYRTLPKHNTLQPLFIQVASMQLLALPAVIVVFNLEPIYTPVAFAAVGGAHFLPYTWLHRTPIYGVLAVTVAIGPWALLVAGVTPVAVFHLTGFLVGAAMLAAALAIWRSTAPAAKVEERAEPGTRKMISMNEIATRADRSQGLDDSVAPDETAHKPQDEGLPGAANAPTRPTWRRTLIRISVLYTALTVTSSAFALSAGHETDSHVHLLLRLAFVIVGIGALDLYDLMRQRLPRVPQWVLGAATYTVAVATIMSGIWIWGAAGGDLHPDAFRDAFLNFTGVGVVLTIIIAVVDRVRGRAKPR